VVLTLKDHALVLLVFLGFPLESRGLLEEPAVVRFVLVCERAGRALGFVAETLRTVE